MLLKSVEIVEKMLTLLFYTPWNIGLKKNKFWNIWLKKTDFGDPLPPSLVNTGTGIFQSPSRGPCVAMFGTIELENKALRYPIYFVVKQRL